MPYNRKNKEINRTHWPTKYMITQNPWVSCKRRDRHIVCVTQRSSPQSNHIPFVRALTNKPIRYEKLDYTWAAVRLEANTLLNFRQINQSSKALSVIGYQISKCKKKGLMGVQDSYQDRLFLYNMHMYDEFHVPDVLIVCCTCED